MRGRVVVMDGFQNAIVLSIVSSIFCPLVCAFMLWWGKRYWNNRELCSKDSNALHLGVQALLRDRILHGCRHFTELGHSTHNARVNITRMHEAYEGLGGNSIETIEYKKFMELPHKVEDEMY